MKHMHLVITCIFLISLFYEGIWVAIVNTVTASVGIWTLFCWLPQKLIQTARRKLTVS